MIEGLDTALEDSGQPGLAELRSLLQQSLDGPGIAGRLVEHRPLKPNVHRLRLELNGRAISFIVKRTNLHVARLNSLVANRWLPKAGIGGKGPPLLGSAAERTGGSAWQVYEDLGDLTLQAPVVPELAEAAVSLIAQIHSRFARHPLLGECRLRGTDFGVNFFASNLRDAVYALEAMREPGMGLSPERLRLRDELLRRLYELLAQETYRSQITQEFGVPETLLHGDLWGSNIVFCDTVAGREVRLIDWDHAGVGPLTYDLSTLVYRLPKGDRQWAVDCYQRHITSSVWRAPSTRILNLLFETAELARLANRLIWPAIAVLDGQPDWGFSELTVVGGWFDALEPALPEQVGRAGWEARK